jgi:hypothetical protein
VNKKPPELPNIEDATLRACLAPLMEAMHAGGETANHPSLPDPVPPTPRPQRVPARSPAGSNDNPSPTPEASGAVDRAYSGTPKTRAEWRLLANDEFGAFRMIELFLAMTDAELLAAAADFPKQIGGTVARIARIKRRLAAQYDTVTTAVALLERAIARAAADRGDD